MPDVDEWELRYWPHGKPIPEGWTRHDGLDDTHHGEYACLIVKEKVELCSCGQPLKEEQMHGHYVCIHCKCITSGCCGDI